MINFNVFIMRAILGIAFGVLLIRMFHPEASIFQMGGLAVLLVGGAYFLDYWRRRKPKS